MNRIKTPKKVDIILFTYNRAMQADLALRSIRDMFDNVDKVIVFYKHSDIATFGLGYGKLWDKVWKGEYGFPIETAYQYEFGRDFKEIYKRLTADYYTGFCDDDVFVKKTNCDSILEKLNEPDVSAISLKIHAKQTNSYPGVDTPLPNFIETEPYLKWNWRKYHRYDVDWGYPTNVNAMIFPRQYFSDLIMPNTFKCPNSMEGSLNVVRNKFKDCLVSFKETRVLNIAANLVQTNNKTPEITTHLYTIEDLNRRFLDGEIISTENIYNKEVTWTSTELEYKFKRS